MVAKRITNPEELQRLCDKARNEVAVREESEIMVSVCAGHNESISHDHQVARALLEEVRALGIDARVGMKGRCELSAPGTVVEIRSPRDGVVLYGEVTPELVPRLVRTHFAEGEILREHLLVHHQCERAGSEL
ncbi:MAG: hypothetical protein K9L28_07325 [Synergistales bacterium]|nr:hypothetical protein [Synergistales bacterium]